GKLAAAWQWLTGQSSSAHYVRVGTALALLAWGTLDQARYYLALHAESGYDLQRAASLNSYDSSLQMRLGQRELEEGLPEEAEASWRRAITSDPANPAPRHALLRFLIDHSRFDEALDLTEASLKYAPKDSRLLVNRGLLLLQKGHADQAMANWEQAIAVDP